MPKKLVLDRGISLELSGQKATVPEGEMWSVSIHQSNGGAIAILDGDGQLRSFARASIYGGTSITAHYNTGIITGFAFKFQEV